MALPEYIPTGWVNGTAPAINSLNLGKLEQGIKRVTDEVIQIGDIRSYVDTENAKQDATIDNMNDLKIEADDYATDTEGGTMKARLDGTDLYLTTDGNNP